MGQSLGFGDAAAGALQKRWRDLGEPVNIYLVLQLLSAAGRLLRSVWNWCRKASPCTGEWSVGGGRKLGPALGSGISFGKWDQLLQPETSDGSVSVWVLPMC